jgi:hypothetical protein
VRTGSDRACPGHNRDLHLQRNLLSHLAIPVRSCVGSSQGSPAEAFGPHGGVGAVVGLGVLGHHDEAIPADAQQLADAACGVEVVERSLGDT